MKTWQRILIVVFLLLIAVKVGVYELTRHAHAESVNAVSLSNLHMLGVAMMMYSDDFNDQFPDLSNPETMKIALLKYFPEGDVRAFVHPTTGQPYQPNSALTYQRRQGPNAFTNIVVVYEAEPAYNGTHGIVFADGHADRVNESHWQELKKISNIP